MKTNEIKSETTSAYPDKFDRLIEYLLIALFAFMPLGFGAVRAWGKEIVIILSGVIFFCFMLKVFLQRCQILKSRAYIPVLIFLVLVIFQLIGLGEGIVRLISPNTASLKAELLSDSPNAQTLSGSMTLSFYANATKHDLRLLIALSGVFFTVVNYFDDKEKIKRILKAIAYIGGIVAGIALVQNIFGNGKMYWLIAPKSDGIPTGSFVNHSHYSQFMNLSLGAAIGLLLVRISGDFSGKKINLAEVFEYLSGRTAKEFWILAGIIITGSATIFMSLSRGGMISMLVALFFTILLLSSRPRFRKHGRLTATLAIIAFASVIYTSFDSVYERLGSLREAGSYENRMQTVKDLTRSFRSYPVLGTGMGTHRVVYPMYDSSNLTTVSTHAENEYAQLLEETGILGLGTIVFFGFIIAVNFVRNIRSRDLAITALTYGLGFGLTAILIHSLSDFGQHLPANSFLSVTYCGLIIAMAGAKRKRAGSTFWIPRRKSAFLVLFLLGLAAFWWSAAGAERSRIAEANWDNLQKVEKRLIANSWQGSKEQYSRLISRAEKALEADGDNAIYRYWYNVYRWRQLCLEIDDDWGEIPAESMPQVKAILDDLEKARGHCPTYGPIHSLAGQIEYRILEKESGIAKINKGYLLAPCDAIVCFAAGSTDIAEGKAEESFEKLHKAVELDGIYFRDAADIYIEAAQNPELAIRLAGENIQWLEYLAGRLSDYEEYKDFAGRVKERLKGLLEERCEQADVTALELALLGDMYRQEGQNEYAAELYERALSIDYGKVSWRLSLAKVLAETGQRAEAIKQARLCLKISPQMPGAKELISELSTK